MKKKLNYQAFIDKFLNGEMEGEELQWFRGEMEVNPRLSEEVRLQQEVSEAIVDEDVMELRDQMSRLFDSDRRTIKEESGKRVSPTVVKLAAASMIAVLMAIASLFHFYGHNDATEDLFSMHYETYDGVMNVRSGDAHVDEIMTGAIMKYENGKFEEAASMFEDVLKADPGNVASRFYAGISHMETERYQKASGMLTEVIDHNDNLFVENARWYLGLCYLKMENPEKAREQFGSLAEGEGFYSDEAAKILDRLRENG